jgi:Glycine rich protein
VLSQKLRADTDMHKKNAIKLVLVVATLGMAGCGSDRTFVDDTPGNDSATTDAPPGSGGDGSADSTMDVLRPDVPSADAPTDLLVDRPSSMDAAEAGTVDTGSDAPEEVDCSTTPSPTISASGPTSICPGRSVTLTSSAAAGYLWSEGSTTQAITVSTAGTYRVTTTDNRRCMAISAPTVVSVYPAPTVPTITATGSTRFCTGGNVMLTASSAASYLWSTGATTQSIVVTDTGGYTVTTTNINGCPATSAPIAVTRVVPPPGSQLFNYTGADATFTVPECVTSITVDAYGAQGGNGTFYLGGLGGRVQATLTVVPNTSLNIRVGGAGGGPCPAGGMPGFNGGGQGNCDAASDSGAGGGATDIRVSPFGIGNRIVVAGAGGGAGFNCGTTSNQPDHGGAGGGLTGQQYPSLCTPAGAGRGGTQTAGGVGGTSGANQAGSGGLGFGGFGSPMNGVTGLTEGGGGGGGYSGGGGGLYGGGGGGSSFVTATGSSAITHTQGVRSGHGMLTISW